ncbi:MAG: hypothetical protein ACFB02_19430 [Mastigocoleus sp.]
MGDATILPITGLGENPPSLSSCEKISQPEILSLYITINYHHPNLCDRSPT